MKLQQIVDKYYKRYKSPNTLTLQILGMNPVSIHLPTQSHVARAYKMCNLGDVLLIDGLQDRIIFAGYIDNKLISHELGLCVIDEGSSIKWTKLFIKRYLKLEATANLEARTVNIRELIRLG